MLYILEFDVLPLSLLWILTENVLDTNRLSMLIVKSSRFV